MASDLIYREDAKIFVRHACYKKINPIDYLDEVPAADVRPVVRGKWTMHSDRPDTLICTACDHAFDVWVWDHKWMHFCPNCGADMREVSEDGNSEPAGNL